MKKPTRVTAHVKLTAWEMDCERCGKRFRALRRGHSRFCSARCQHRSWAAIHRPRGVPRKKASQQH